MTRPLVEQRAELVADFPGPDATATLNEHADRVLGMVGGQAPADLLAQARVQVLEEHLCSRPRGRRVRQALATLRGQR